MAQTPDFEGLAIFAKIVETRSGAGVAELKLPTRPPFSRRRENSRPALWWRWWIAIHSARKVRAAW